MKSTNRAQPENRKKLLPLPRLIFILVMLCISVAIMWPGYAFFSSASPLILGFPLSFAWIIFWVIIGFIAMISLYISDSNRGGHD